MERWQVKMTCGFIMLMAMLIVTLLPIKVTNAFLRQGKRGEFLLDILTCFSGGVFFGTLLLFMLPESRLLLELNLTGPRNIHFPVPEVIMGGGFFLVMAIEKLAHLCAGHDVDRAVTRGQENLAMDHKISAADEEDSQTPTTTSTSSGANHSEQATSSDNQRMYTRIVIITLALGLDSVLEGVTIGLQRFITKTWIIFAGVLAHEAVIAFSMSVQLNRKLRSYKPVVAVSIVYSLLNPIGVAIGTTVFETQGDSGHVLVISGCLQAVTAGLFIYITFFEILSGQIDENIHFGKMLAIFLGFVVMAGLAGIPHEGLSKLSQNQTDAVGVVMKSTV